MNGFWEMQQALVASRQADLRREADTTRRAADATLAASAERTRHADTGNTPGHAIGSPRAIVAVPAARSVAQPAPTASVRTSCEATEACNERTLAA